MKKVLGMLCACLLLVSSFGTGLQVQAESSEAKSSEAKGSEIKSSEIKNEKPEIQPDIKSENLFCYESLEGSRCVSVVKADTETGWGRENVPEEDINATSRLIYDGPVSVRVNLPKKNKEMDDTEKKEEDIVERTESERFVVSVFHNGTEIWHAPVEKEETFGFVCQISGWEWQEETQSYELLVSCFAEGDYQISIDEVISAEEKDHKEEKADSEEVRLLGKSAVVTVDRTPPEAFLSWRSKTDAAGETQPEGIQMVDLSIRDANFRPSEVDWKIQVKDYETEQEGEENCWMDVQTSSLTKWSDWERDEQDQNLWHAAVILYTDGIYQMELKASDLAGHSLKMSCMGTLVLDTVSPLLAVDYPMPVQKYNGKLYYADKVDMILTVTEMNFIPEDFRILMTRNDEAEDVQAEWIRIGTGQYQCVVSLEKDGEYKLQTSYTDPYGNKMEPYCSEKIVIDRTAPEIKVTGIHADTAGKAAISNAALYVRDAGGSLDPDSLQPLLKRVVVGEDGTFLTEEVLLPIPVKDSDTGGWKYHIPELTEDGIYTLTCQAQDFSKNKTNEIKTEDGILHQKIKFSINRHGSTFEVDDTAIELAERYYVYNVESDVEIREVNTDLIEEYTVHLNGMTLQEGKDFTTTASTGDGAWSMRHYMVKKELFAQEGEYDLVVESLDKAGTKAYSDVKAMKLSWVVDQSAPTVLLTDLEANHFYEGEEQQVTALPSDEGGKIKTFQVSVMDALGKNRQMLVNLTGEKLEQYLRRHDGQVQFSIPEGVEQQVEIFCADQAWKKGGGTNEYHEVINGVSVAKNQKSLRRMKREMEKKVKENTKQSETGSNPEVDNKKRAVTVWRLVLVTGVGCCAAVIGGRKIKRKKRTHN